MRGDDGRGVRGRANRIRSRVLRRCHQVGSADVGRALSLVDVLTVLYDTVLRRDEGAASDRLVLGKRGGVAALAATVAEFDRVDQALVEVALEGARAGSAPGRALAPRRAGDGLAVATGLALAAERSGAEGRVFAIVGHEECDRAATAEALVLAPALGLEQLVALVDDDRDRPDPCLGDRLRALGWGAREVDGHDYVAVRKAFARLPLESGRPSALVVRSRCGAGVSFLENDPRWRRERLGPAELRRALAELGEE